MGQAGAESPQNQPMVRPAKPAVALQEKLLRQTLTDARLTVAQEAPRKAQHGRYEVRTLWTLSSADLNAYAGSAGSVGKPWPGLAQVSRIQRVVCQRDPKSGQWQRTEEVAYSITSLPANRANATEILKRWRIHWRIEALHWIRDVTLGEDGSQIHVGQNPEAFSILRNAATTLLSLSGAPSIAAGIRELQMSPTALLSTFSNLANRLKAARHSTKTTSTQSPTSRVLPHQLPTRQQKPTARDPALVK